MFNKTIKPILLYGSEIWGFGNCDIIERVQLNFYKYIFNLKRTTPSFMIYGELGITPIIVDINARVASFWSKIIEPGDGPTKLSYLFYKIIYNLHKNSNCKSSFAENVKNIIESCGFSGFWITQSVPNPKWFSLAIFQKAKDQYMQEWATHLKTASSGTNYKLFKDTLFKSQNLSILSNFYCKKLSLSAPEIIDYQSKLVDGMAQHQMKENVPYVDLMLGMSSISSCHVNILTQHEND